jgi:O-methyltransferase involved in polyketide biosynthesis
MRNYSFYLTGVPETMLWTMHDRASVARQSGGILTDPDCVRIHDEIAYDYAGTFGMATGLFAQRAVQIDRVLRRWLSRHPDGFVVSLGEGLETQVRRVDNGRMRWLSVDLPEAIAVRERFIPPTQRFHHCAASALDEAWMDMVDSRNGVFIIAQGLLMYLELDLVVGMLGMIARRFPGAEMVFDLVPRSMSRATTSGDYPIAGYRPPSMPWGLDRNEVRAALSGWHLGLAMVRRLRYRLPSGRPGWVEDCLDALLPRRNNAPSLMHIQFQAPLEHDHAERNVQSV